MCISSTKRRNRSSSTKKMSNGTKNIFPSLTKFNETGLSDDSAIYTLGIYELGTKLLSLLISGFIDIVHGIVWGRLVINITKLYARLFGQRTRRRNKALIQRTSASHGM